MAWYGEPWGTPGLRESGPGAAVELGAVLVLGLLPRRLERGRSSGRLVGLVPRRWSSRSWRRDPKSLDPLLGALPAR